MPNITSCKQTEYNLLIKMSQNIIKAAVYKKIASNQYEVGWTLWFMTAAINGFVEEWSQHFTPNKCKKWLALKL